MLSTGSKDSHSTQHSLFVVHVVKAPHLLQHFNSDTIQAPRSMFSYYSSPKIPNKRLHSEYLFLYARVILLVQSKLNEAGEQTKWRCFNG